MKFQLDVFHKFSPPSTGVACEAGGHSRNSNKHYRVHEIQPLARSMSHPNTIHTVISFLTMYPPPVTTFFCLFTRRDGSIAIKRKLTYISHPYSRGTFRAVHHKNIVQSVAWWSAHTSADVRILLYYRKTFQQLQNPRAVSTQRWKKAKEFLSTSSLFHHSHHPFLSFFVSSFYKVFQSAIISFRSFLSSS